MKFQPTLIGYTAVLVLAYLLLTHPAAVNNALTTAFKGYGSSVKALQGR